MLQSSRKLCIHVSIIHDFLVDNCGTYEFENCTSWTGGNDIETEGSYKWDHSNTNIHFTNWHPTEPSNLIPDEALTRDCIDILRTGLWNDRPCSYLNSFICEKFSDESEIAIMVGIG